MDVLHVTNPQPAFTTGQSAALNRGCPLAQRLRLQTAVHIKQVRNDGSIYRERLDNAEATRDREHLVQAEAFEPTVKIFGLQAASLEFAHAAEAPEVLGDFVDQDFFGLVGGPVFGAEGGAKFVQFGRIFAGQDEFLGIEPVLEGVVFRVFLAFDGLGTGGVLRIGAIDFRSGWRWRD